MVPMRHSSIFKSRWMALVWAAGILWAAYDWAGGQPQADGNDANAEAATDVTGAAISREDQKRFEDAVNGL